MNSLYEIEPIYQAVLAECREYANDHNGELSPDLSAKLDGMEMVREAKIENSLKYYKNEQALAEMIEGELAALQARIKTHKGNADWMKQRLAGIVEVGRKMEFSSGKISWRTSHRVEVRAENLIPEDCFKVERTLVKSEVEKRIKAGTIAEEIAYIAEYQNLQLK